MDSREKLLNRYYKSLYELLLPSEILSSKNLKEFLKLVISSSMYDPNSERCIAILKRLLQTAASAEPSYICCVLIIISQVLNNKNSLWKYIEQLKLSNQHLTSQSDGQIKDKDEKVEEKSLSKLLYENLNKRDPKYVLNNCLVEITIFLDHYHPTVQKWTKQIVENFKTEPIEYEGDPLLDFSLVNFLNKFITKNPKLKNLKKHKKTNEEDENLNTNEEHLNFIEKFSNVKDLSDKLLKKKQKQKVKNIDDYADKVMEDEIAKMEVGKDDDFSDDIGEDENQYDSADEDEEFDDEIEEDEIDD